MSLEIKGMVLNISLWTDAIIYKINGCGNSKSIRLASSAQKGLYYILYFVNLNKSSYIYSGIFTLMSSKLKS